MATLRGMPTQTFNKKVFGITRAHVNSQSDLHIAASVPRYDAQGDRLDHWDTDQICGCVACEAYDLRFPEQRMKVNRGRFTADKGHKMVREPTTYVTGNPFGTPNQDMLGLLRTFKGDHFGFDAPAVMPSAAQTAHMFDAGMNRSTAMRKDQQQNLRDAAALAGLPVCRAEPGPPSAGRAGCSRAARHRRLALCARRRTPGAAWREVQRGAPGGAHAAARSRRYVPRESRARFFRPAID